MLDERQRAIQDYYRSGSVLHAAAELDAESIDARAARAREYYEDNYLPLLPVERDGAVLDIGCGEGAFLDFMRRQGFQRLEGTEIASAAVAHCRRLGFAVVESDDPVVFLRARPGGYSLIHLGHFIEHVPKTLMFEFLHALREGLVPGGRLLVATPNMSHFGGVVHRYKTFGHEIGFTEWSLDQLLRRADFRDVCVVGDRQRIHGRPKRLLWIAAQRLVRLWLKGLYLVEMGSDRPRILSMSLLAIARR